MSSSLHNRRVRWDVRPLSGVVRKVGDEQIMKQRQVIVAVVVVGLLSAAIWVWHQSAQQQNAELATAKPSAQLQEAFHDPSTPAGSSEPAPASASALTQRAPTRAAPEVDQGAVSAQAHAAPANVDTPEPAERKFARGGRADNSDQSPN